MRLIFCCECQKEVEAYMIKGKAAYPHRKDLFSKNFWQCPVCLNFVGTHMQGTSTKPTGCIPNSHMKLARREIHAILDPLWKSKRFSRSEVYQKISDFLGYEYHTGELKSIEEARKVYKYVRTL